MKALDIFANLQTDQGQPLVGTVVQLECFSLQAADWVVMGEGKTEAQGQLRIRVEMPLSDEATAPQVRLTLAAAPAQRVLAEGGRISYVPRTGLLSIDFGTLTTLAQPVPLQPATADRRFRAVASPQMMGVSAAARPLFQTTGVATATAATPLRENVAITRPGVTPADTVAVPIRGLDLDNNPTVIDLRKQIATKELDLTGITKQHAEVQTKLNLVQGERDGLAEKVGTIERKNLDLIKELEAIKVRPVLGNVVPLKSLTQDLQSQFSSVQASMANVDNGMRLGDVRIKLRGKLGPDGQFQLPRAEDLLKPDANNVLDEVDFGLLAPEVGAADLNVPVPNLARLTEGAARQVLQSMGLRLEAAVGSVQEGFVSGQAMRQAPAAGGQAVRGGTVLVVFAQ
ncbi:MAG: hypothetical protein C4K60_15675 [Ideonella sp. MAG2]|nr:MAG: hypothetical protein C4K60_15675 [Ideonella sp. MAG2]